jgi:hypothetical protein
MPVLKYRPFCVVSSANVKNIGFLNVYELAAIQHWHFLFLAIANLNRQDLIGELLIFRNADQGMILRSFVCLGTFSQRTYGRSLQYIIFRI